MSDSKKTKPRYTLPANTLKEKVGDGGIPADRLVKAQDFIRHNDIDFPVEGRKHLAALAALLAEAKQAGSEKKARTLNEKIVLEVMQLKAHGGMFHYGLVSLVSDVVLQFMEKIKTVNPDVLAIMAAYTNTIDVIFENEMRGDGGEEGLSLAWELDQASQRYLKKYAV